MESNKLYHLLLSNFVFEPNLKQQEAMIQLSKYIMSTSSRGVFLLKGYAGTGKTTLVSALVKSLWPVGKKTILLAPTGRAAKVLSVYSEKSAVTIHKKIYWIKTNSKGNTYVTLQKNKHSNTVFVVDEASMIPDVSDRGFGGRSLLDDLITYVYEGLNCKLILIGDTAQLPPVHLDVSPALNEELLVATYNREVYRFELTEVMRQSFNSMILKNATKIRELISEGNPNMLKLLCNKEVARLQSGIEIQDALEDAYSQKGVESTVVICRSNKRANLYNQQIRKSILFNENSISAGDLLIITKNNYFWSSEKLNISFLANGDIIQILEIFSIKELYGFKFAEVKVKLVDYADEPILETIILLDTLNSDLPALSYDQSNKLYNEVQKDYINLKSKYKRFIKTKENPFFNALNVKFSYALTCHKAQGGQWPTVFIEKPYLKEGVDMDYLRWLYTAVTRAEKRLYLIGF